ncbi:glycoside hydrolase [Penicillium malachiteum]|uniref:Glycoside hydrolase n=1 Tax=Penicillium malachiteum TaxID=1324776 RepID=A0AAD6MVX6_9EURO|nr:glycoside hydrolase [Penicillium malachiteum]
MTAEQSIAPPPIILTFLPNIAFPPLVTTNYSTIGIGPITVTVDDTATITSPPSTTTAAAAGIVTPTPYPANMASGCTDFHLVQSGDSCWSIETSYGIDASDFDACNPDVGTGCADGIWLDYYYCISNSDETSSSSTIAGSEIYKTKGCDDDSNTVSWGTTSHTVTIQPGATQTTINPEKTLPVIKVKSKTTKTTDSDDTKDTDDTTDSDDTKDSDDDDNTDSSQCDGCGTLDCDLWGCDGGCGIFGCEGGCGLWWCGGGCGLEYCGPGCGSTGKILINVRFMHKEFLT